MKQFFGFVFLLICTIGFITKGNSSPTYIIEEDIVSIKMVFNQPKYIAGDTAFFKSFIAGLPDRFIKGRRIVGFTLKNSSGVDLIYIRFLFINGFCENQIILPDNLLPGAYWLAASIEGLGNQVLLKTPFIVSGNLEYELLMDPPINSKLMVDIQPNRDQYLQREKVVVQLSNVIDQSQVGNFCVSVIKESLFNSMDFSDDEEFESRYQGSYNLLGSINSDKIFEPKSASFISGNAVFSSSQRAVPDSTLIIFYLNRVDFVYQVATSKEGRFEFQLFKEFSDEEVFYNVFNKKGRIDSVDLILDTPINSAEDISPKETYDPNYYFQYSTTVAKINDSYAYYLNRDKLMRESIFDWWPEVDYEINMDKYEPFYTMEEVFTNVIPTVKFRKGGSEEGARVFIKNIATYTNHAPIYLIDGVMTDNSTYVNSMDPNKIVRIGVCRSPEILARYGELGANGIIAIETDFDRSEEIVPRSKNSFFVTGINRRLKFQGVKDTEVSSLKSRIPKFRATLYWNSDMVPPKKGETISFNFFSSDDIGYYRILVFGFTKKGSILSRHYRIQVVAE